MAAAAGIHDPAALADDASGASGATLFDLSVSPSDTRMAGGFPAGGSSRRRLDRSASHTPSDRERSPHSRSGSTKRAGGYADGRPPRGRPDSPWDDDLRATHRRIQYPEDPHASAQNALEALKRQSEADREHMSVLKGAIGTIYISQRQQMVDLTSCVQRVDSVDNAQERDRSLTRAELQRIAAGVPARITGAVQETMQPIATEVAKLQAYVEQLHAERPAEGMRLVENFKLLDANIAEMKAKLNEYSVQTDGRISAAQGAAISAAQGAAAAMPESEILTLTGMHRELEILKGMSANTATNAEVAHLERRANFTDIQLAGTNERMTVITTQIGSGTFGDPGRTTEEGP